MIDAIDSFRYFAIVEGFLIHDICFANHREIHDWEGFELSFRDFVKTCAFALLILILSVFPFLEILLKDKSNHFEIHLELKDKTKLRDFIFTLRKLDIHIDDIEINRVYVGSGLSVYSVSLTSLKKKGLSHKDIIEALSSLEYVSYVDEIN